MILNKEIPLAMHYIGFGEEQYNSLGPYSKFHTDCTVGIITFCTHQVSYISEHTGLCRLFSFPGDNTLEI